MCENLISFFLIFSQKFKMNERSINDFFNNNSE